MSLSFEFPPDSGGVTAAVTGKKCVLMNNKAQNAGRSPHREQKDHLNEQEEAEFHFISVAERLKTQVNLGTVLKYFPQKA